MSRADMVRAYAESLLEQVLKTDRIRPDKDGDYPVRYQSALYYVRVDPGQNDDPVVQVFAKVLADITPSSELFEHLNEINTQLRFARIFWVRDQVLVESEMPGMALSLEGLGNACNTVGGAADYFGPRLAEVFGGKTAFADEKGPDYEEPANWPGQYL
jgi:hypothetical protein